MFNFPPANPRLRLVKVSKDFSTLTGANPHTDSVSLFTLVGGVAITRIWGVVKTALGNHTAASFQSNDATAQVAITAASGVTLTNILAGSVVAKTTLSSTAATKLDNAATVGSDVTITGIEQMLIAKSAVTTSIQYKFTTTDLTDVGAMDFYVLYYPLTDDGKLIPV